jgi:hypothetical protein
MRETGPSSTVCSRNSDLPAPAGPQSGRYVRPASVRRRSAGEPSGAGLVEEGWGAYPPQGGMETRVEGGKAGLIGGAMDDTRRKQVGTSFGSIAGLLTSDRSPT